MSFMPAGSWAVTKVGEIDGKEMFVILVVLEAKGWKL